MPTDSTGTVPETARTADAVAEPMPGVAVDGDRPTGETPSGEELARMARAGAPDGGMPTDALTTARLQGQTNTVVEHLGAYYADPNAAHDRLHALGPKEREALLAGDASVLGELRDDAPTTGLRPDALVAHRDVYERNPEAAAAVTEQRAERLEDPDRGTKPDRGDAPERPDQSPTTDGMPIDPAGNIQGGAKDGDLAKGMSDRVIAYSMSPHQI